jgi:predicted O-linked N-acetylglucosamine transferase (SPINDLY family)
MLKKGRAGQSAVRSVVLLALGKIEANQQNAQAAVNLFVCSLRMQPESIQAFRALTQTLVQKLPQFAEATITSLLDTAPSLPASTIHDEAVRQEYAGQARVARILFEAAIRQQPNFVEAHINLASNMQSSAKSCTPLQPIADQYKTAVSLMYKDECWHSLNRSCSLTPEMSSKEHAKNYAMSSLVTSRQRLLQWGEPDLQILADVVTASIRAELLENAKVISVVAHAANNLPFDPSEIVAMVRTTMPTELLHQKAIAIQTDEDQNWCKVTRRTSTANRIFRVGYISTDFKSHPMGQLMIGVLKHHAKKEFPHVQFNVTCFSLESAQDNIKHDPLYKQFQRECPQFVPLEVPVLVGSSTEPASAVIASIIRGHCLDAAIDISGLHVMRSDTPDLMAIRPAPLQVAYMGYPDRSGTRWLDYVAVDPVVIAVEVEAARLAPQCSICCNCPGVEVAPHTPAGKCCKQGGVTERLMILPASFFVGSHGYLYPEATLPMLSENRPAKRAKLWQKYHHGVRSFFSDDTVIFANFGR